MEKITGKIGLIWPVVISVVLTWVTWGVNTMDMHGGVPMGVSNHNCDDAHTNLTIDGDFKEDKTKKEYQCVMGRHFPVKKGNPSMYCQDETDQPLHVCMDESITYRQSPPLSGAHRPLWPQYGEYVYLPPQRWLHSLEHGAIVLLYHPCADPEQLVKLKSLVRSCLRRHVITPYRKLTAAKPFALLSWGCKLTMGYVMDNAVKQFIKVHGISPAPEAAVHTDGQYGYGLTVNAVVVSDVSDSNLCPDKEVVERYSDSI